METIGIKSFTDDAFPQKKRKKMATNEHTLGKGHGQKTAVLVTGAIELKKELR